MNSNGTRYIVGQTVVHASHGIGKIVGIETRQFGPNTSEFYIINIDDNGAPKKVFVPTSNVERLRPIANDFEVRKVVAFLNKNNVVEYLDYTMWNKRYMHYMDLIHSGELMNIAKVKLALDHLSHEKELNFGERKLLEQANRLLTDELNAAGYNLN